MKSLRLLKSMLTVGLALLSSALFASEQVFCRRAETFTTQTSRNPPPADSTHRASGRGEYALVLYAGGGLSWYSTPVGVPDGTQGVNVNRQGVPITFRVMWHPDQQLRVGMESGYLPLYDYTSQSAGKPGEVKVAAIPILLFWSVPVGRRFNLLAGSGAYLIQSRLSYAGTADVSKASLGWMVAASYQQPLARNLALAAEIKWMTSPETEDAALMAQLQLVWKFLRW